MNDQWYDLIYGYLEEELSDQDLIIFNNKYDTDPDFKRAFVQEKKLFEGVRYAAEAELREEIKSFQKNTETSVKSIPLKTRWISNRAAAALLILSVGMVAYFAVKEKKQESIAEKDLLEVEVDSPITGSTGTEILLEKLLPVLMVNNNLIEGSPGVSIRLQVKSQLDKETAYYLFNEGVLTLFQDEPILTETTAIAWYQDTSQDPGNYLKIEDTYFSIKEGEEGHPLVPLAQTSWLPFMTNSD